MILDTNLLIPVSIQEHKHRNMEKAKICKKILPINMMIPESVADPSVSHAQPVKGLVSVNTMPSPVETIQNLLHSRLLAATCVMRS